jgi:hypothetical protein
MKCQPDHHIAIVVVRCDGSDGTRKETVAEDLMAAGSESETWRPRAVSPEGELCLAVQCPQEDPINNIRRSSQSLDSLHVTGAGDPVKVG